MAKFDIVDLSDDAEVLQQHIRAQRDELKAAGNEAHALFEVVDQMLRGLDLLRMDTEDAQELHNRMLSVVRTTAMGLKRFADTYGDH